MLDPYKTLAASIEERVRRHAHTATLGIAAELGTITATGLKLDGFAHEIQNYLVAADLALPTVLGPDSAGDTLSTPEGLRALRAGDRVLVVPVNRGQDHVVVARVVRHA